MTLVNYDLEIQEIWEAKERALKRLDELCKSKSLANQESPELDRLSEEQKQWIKEKMKRGWNK